MFLEWVTQDTSNVVHKLNMASTIANVYHMVSLNVLEWLRLTPVNITYTVVCSLTIA